MKKTKATSKAARAAKAAAAARATDAGRAADPDRPADVAPPDPAPPSSQARAKPPATPPADAPRGRGRGRAGIAAVLVISLLATALLQHVAYSHRAESINRVRPKGVQAPSRVANLDSFSLALMLGGLRGPLVMFLWTSSESQKNERDLESFDTKVEMIRLLQPEFDTVHLFQMWNLMYNVSVQYATNANKYGAILDGIEYGRRAEETNPNSINLVAAIAGGFAEKLGGSTEKEYYMRRVRTETLPVYKVTFPAARAAEFKRAAAAAGLDEARLRLADDAGGATTTTVVLEKVVGDRVLAAFKGPDVSVAALPRQTLRPPGQTGRRFEMDTMLDADGRILPELVRPLYPVPPGETGNDGSELQYLTKFKPFRYGISPLALGYNYFKRAQILQVVGKQKHAQVSEFSLDGRPGQTLKQWSEEEWERGRRLEQRGLGAPPAAEQVRRELRTATYGPDAKVADAPAIDEAIFSYERAVEVGTESLVESDRHMKAYPATIQTYMSNADDLRAVVRLNAGDALYLRAIKADPAARPALLAEARAEYEQSARLFHLLMLKYYVDEADARRFDYVRADVPNKSLAELRDLLTRVRAGLKERYRNVVGGIPHADELQEYEDNLRRIDERLAKIK